MLTWSVQSDQIACWLGGGLSQAAKVRLIHELTGFVYISPIDVDALNEGSGSVFSPTGIQVCLRDSLFCLLFLKGLIYIPVHPNLFEPADLPQRQLLPVMLFFSF